MPRPARGAVAPIDIDVGVLRAALDPGRGSHFHTGRKLVGIVGCEDAEPTKRKIDLRTG